MGRREGHAVLKITLICLSLPEKLNECEFEVLMNETGYPSQPILSYHFLALPLAFSSLLHRQSCQGDGDVILSCCHWYGGGGREMERAKGRLILEINM